MPRSRYRRGRAGGRAVRLRIDTKAFFFDRPAVQRAIREMQLDPKRYEHFAASIRMTARRSIRKVTARPESKAYRRPSTSPKPPRSRDAQHRLRRIEYKWDFSLKSMVVGPVFYSGTTSRPGQTVPSLHEKAKSAVIRRTIVKRVGGVVGGQRARSAAQAAAYKRLVQQGRLPSPLAVIQVTETANYPPRPFMVPATKKMASKFPKMWSTKLA